MGFYGNITNISRTQFSFDRTYQNRATMERAMYGDGVYVGRYVLIEYDSDTISQNNYKRVYRDSESDFPEAGGFLYSDESCQLSTRIKFTTNEPIYDHMGQVDVNYGVAIGTVVYTLEDNLFTTFYQCVGRIENDAIFSAMSTDSSYTFNYGVDKAWAKEKGYNDIGRGWDSTVWQKVYQNGIEKYVMVAELNTVVPSFGLSADAPSLSPLTPHFGSNSTNVYYNLHWQPAWALRMRPADSKLLLPVLEANGTETDKTISASSYKITTPSDLSIEWQKSEYDKAIDKTIDYKFNIKTNSWQDISTITSEDKTEDFQIKSSIYFNNAGFDSDVITYSTDLSRLTIVNEEDNTVSRVYDGWDATENKIAIEPTGYSGHKYNNHENNLITTPEVDTQELSIMLPALGNTVAEMWDLIYGGRSNSPEILSTNRRNKDITWEDASRGGEKRGLRLINKKDGVYSYDIHQVETLAGCINSVHDILGMIITDEILDENNIQTADEKWIYYNSADKTYSRKHKIYTYPTTGSLQDYKSIELTEFDPTLDYYERRHNNYLKLTEPREHIDYYQLVQENLYGEFEDSYEANKFYYKEPTDDTNRAYKYILDTNLAPTGSRNYIALHEYDDEGNVLQGPVQHMYFFFSDARETYYVLRDGIEEASGIDDYIESTDTHIVQDRKYFFRTITRTPTSTFIQFIEIDPAELVEFVENTYYTYSDGVYLPIESCPITKDRNSMVLCYTFPYQRDGIYFYEPNKYYYKHQDNFLLDLNQKFTEGRIYYTPQFNLIEDVVFYLPNKYYYHNGTQYVFDDSDAITTDRNYYEKLLKYVAEDTAGAFPVGSVWNENITNVPSSVTLCNREESWELQPLQGFSDNVNTLYGLILQIRNILEYGDEFTRDRNTVQGSINLLHDIIAKFDILRPADIMITDEYGRIHGATQSTAQSYGYTNVGTDTTVSPGAAQEDQWIEWMVDPDASNSTITITHAAHTVTDTTTTSDKNAAGGTGLNAAADDDLILYTPIVDNIGHIVGKNMETVTLPYGFKTFKIANSNAITDALSTVTSNGEIVADNTKDLLNIVSTNKWIKLDNATTDTIKIGHAVNAIDTVANATTNLNLENGATDEENINIPDFTYDEAGHITAKKSHTYTLPFGFKILKSLVQSEDDNAWTSAAGAEVEIVADSTQDTLTLATGNKWIRAIADITLDKVTLAHETHEVTPTTSTATLASTTTTNTFDVPTYSFDVAGHYDGLDTKTITLPCSYGIISDGTNTTAATVTVDTLSVVSGDSWLTTSVAADTVTITHNNPVSPETTVTISNATPAFGSTFTIEDWTFDSKGHQNGYSTHTVTIPPILITNSVTDTVPPQQITQQSYNLLTNISFNNVTNEGTYLGGVFTLERTNLVDLTIHGFSSTYLDNNNNITFYSGTPQATDTLGVALAKLSNHVNVLDTTLNDATTGALAQINTINSSINDTGGLVDQIAEINSTLDIINDSNAELTYNNNITYILSRTSNGIEWIAMDTWKLGGIY